MKIVCIRHVAFEGPGIIEDWAIRAGHDFYTVKAYENETIPSARSLDALVVMGGPMSANDEAKHPWLTGVKALIGQVLAADKPILGICLGSQLLAGVLGSRVCRNAEKEIGWFPVQLTEAGMKHPFTSHLPREFTTFHWHGDTYELPEGAVHLAHSPACRQQAFVFGKALGLQFHMEITEAGIEELSERCAHEFVEAPYIQARENILGRPETDFNHLALRAILDRWSV